MKGKNGFWKKYEKDIENLKLLSKDQKSENSWLFEDLLNLIGISIERDSKYKEILKKIEMFEASNNFLVLPPSVKRFSLDLIFKNSLLILK
jgi:hypothetical protein